MTDQFEDYYELLELSPNANHETIERVFRYFATKWHPDAGGDKEKFTLLTRAFETLRDPATRAAYDAEGRCYDCEVRAELKLPCPFCDGEGGEA